MHQLYSTCNFFLSSCRLSLCLATVLLCPFYFASSFSLVLALRVTIVLSRISFGTALLKYCACNRAPLKKEKSVKCSSKSSPLSLRATAARIYTRNHCNTLLYSNEAAVVVVTAKIRGDVMYLRAFRNTKYSVRRKRVLFSSNPQGPPPPFHHSERKRDESTRDKKKTKIKSQVERREENEELLDNRV